jgi:hypothetical protein
MFLFLEALPAPARIEYLSNDPIKKKPPAISSQGV